MTHILRSKGIVEFNWGKVAGSNETYFRVGYWDKFFLDNDLKNIFKEHELEDEDCGPLYSYHIKEN